MKTALELAPIGIAGGFLQTVLFFLLSLSALPLMPMVIWLAVAVLPFALSAVSWLRLRSSKFVVRHVSKRALWKSMLWAGLTGLPWGCAAFLVMGTTPYAELVYLAALGSMTLSTISLLRQIYPAAMAFSIATMLPMLVACLAQGDAEHFRIAGVSFCYLLVLTAFMARGAHMAIEHAEAVQLLGTRTKTLQAIFDNIPAGIALMDKHARMTDVNRFVHELFGLPPEMFQERAPHMLEALKILEARGEFGPDGKAVIRRHLDAVKTKTPICYERERPDGRAISVRGLPVDDIGFLMLYVDLTDRVAAERRIAHLARHDALTGLFNRYAFRTELEAQLSQDKESDAGEGETGALLLLDLDRFKEVNDTMGHPAGDAVLVEVATRLRRCVESDDVIARLGGDEFAIIMRAVPNARPRAEKLAQRIVEAIDEPFEIDRARLGLGISIGIDLFVGHADVDELVKTADIALYHSKEAGRSCATFFVAAMDHMAVRRRQLTYELWEALSNNALHLEYQPIYHLERDAVVGYEALLRWRTAAGEQIPPSEFIPLAEESGAIIGIGAWVIAQACRQAAQWPAHIRVSVNLSLAQFKSPTLLEEVAEAIREAGIPADRLEIEITESMMLQHVEGAAEVLAGLKAIGVSIALDDFGTGHSSFGNLRRNMFDRLKIDRCFVRDLDVQRDVALPLIRAMLQLGRTLGMDVTAEGVETQEQMLALRLEGCTEIQGYLIGKPAAPVVFDAADDLTHAA